MIAVQPFMSDIKSQSEGLEPGSTTSSLSVSKKIHPEDIRLGDDVMISEVMYQYPSYPWNSCSITLRPEDTVDVTFLSPPDTTPMVVKAVCLPFILCKTETSRHRVFDLRQIQLVRLDKTFATQFLAAREAEKAEYETRSKKKKRKKRKSKKEKAKKKKRKSNK